MRVRALSAASVLCLTVATCSATDYAGRGARFRSPQGKFDYAFERPLPNIPRTTARPAPTGELQHIRYQINFYRPSQDTVLATAEFFDVFGSSEAPKARSAQELSGELQWTPQEDAVILPHESRPPSQPRALLSLNSDFAWQGKPFPLEDQPLLWTDRYTAIGEIRDRCSPKVARLDLRTALVQPIAEAPAPAGYRIVTLSPERILMKKEATACATPAEARAIEQDCLTFWVHFGSRELGPCPS
jgi:hypothetical protein